MHPEPAEALSDGAQSLDQAALDELAAALATWVPAQGRSLGHGVKLADQAMLEACRRRIDALDGVLVKLLSERAAIGLRLGQTKLTAGQPLRNVARERCVLDALQAPAGSVLDQAALQRIFRRIMNETLRAEEQAAA